LKYFGFFVFTRSGPTAYFALRRAAMVFIAFANSAFFASLPPFLMSAALFFEVALPKLPYVPARFIFAVAFFMKLAIMTFLSVS
jgi:hypothetical protein